ncbi:MAG: DUF2442 domain-containing protein [candidate division KSB1 bacterium]|nr:DUF2442 domain-containing protein [candidate division KSB1 bacterium]
MEIQLYIGIQSARYLKEYEILLTFENGEKKVFNVLPDLQKGKFIKLKDKNLFVTVHMSFDAIEWDNGVELDPEYVYEQSVQTK